MITARQHSLPSRRPHKLILKNSLSPGDIVMLTAAVRDLHQAYPGQFLTDVRTTCIELWENNPYLTALDEKDPGVEVLDCEYPLIERSNVAPFHCLHGFIQFLNDKLALSITPSIFNGDIHISKLEKSWYSQIWELAGREIPFWIIAAGGKYDVTIKWWDTARYQRVVDHFRGRIQFVQVGDHEHHHPKLSGVIDLRGQTDLRQLVRLVYHAQGVLCGVTALMHLAAAVEVKGCESANRPCVVVAGGREAPHWEAYPSHQFIHTVGALTCCQTGGCWRSRTVPLGDGDRRDKPGELCLDLAGELPRCMAMITPAEVIGRIERYFTGGAIRYLTPAETRGAQKAVQATRNNAYDEVLNPYTARAAEAKFLQSLPPYRGSHRGRGIVICGGGVRYFTNAWVCFQLLRRHGCQLPIQFWHLGVEEMDAPMKRLLQPLGVECVDAEIVRRTYPARRLGGWELKPYAILHSPFREVLLLDADNVPLVNPEFLFDTPEFKRTGAIFWPDYANMKISRDIWRLLGLNNTKRPPFESGQIVVDKVKCWTALKLCLWHNEHSDFYHRHINGDAATFQLAFRKTKKTYAMPRRPIHALRGTMCQHDFAGNRIFQHRNTDKWNLFDTNEVVKDFWLEPECRRYLDELRSCWDGRLGTYPAWTGFKSIARPAARMQRAPRIVACMISCAERARIRRKTLLSLAATDWGRDNVFVQLDTSNAHSKQQRLTETAQRALARCARQAADYVLLLEDDLKFNRFLRHNLENWTPLRNRSATLASIYNPNIRELACDVKNHAMLAHPENVFGSQAFLISMDTVKFVLRHWEEESGMQDIRIPQLVGRLKTPICYHVPSLVQHIGWPSTWGGSFHQAVDFDPTWRNGSAADTGADSTQSAIA